MADNHQVTFAEIKEILNRSAIRQEELQKAQAIAQEQSEREIKQLRASQAQSQAEWQQRQQEWQQRHEKWKAEWEQERKASHQEWQQRHEKWKAEWEQERKASHQEWEQRLKKIGKMVGSIGDNIGDCTEEWFYRSFEIKPVLGSINYDVVHRKIEDDSQKTEYDIMLHNGYASAIIEVKYKAHHKDVQRIVETKTRAFRNSYPQYAGNRLYLGLATFATYPALIETAKEHGIYLLTQQGSHIEVVNNAVESF